MWKMLSSVLVALLVLGGGLYWFFLVRGSEQSFENKPLGTLSAPGETTEPLVEESQPAPSEENSPAQEPAGVTLDSGSQGAAAPPLTEKTSLSIIQKSVAYGFRVPTEKRTIDTVVIHSSYNALGGDVFNNDKIFQEWEEAGVSPHYFIDRGGVIYQLVRESNIAYHAGNSKMPDGRKNVNDFSIGIEMNGTETSGYTTKQYDALNALLADIKTRNKIKSIVGHADIAPDRKTDPWKFDWKKVR